MNRKIQLAAAAVAFLAVPAVAIENSAFGVTRMVEVEVRGASGTIREVAFVTGGEIETGTTEFGTLGTPDAIVFGMKRKGTSRYWKVTAPSAAFDLPGRITAVVVYYADEVVDVQRAKVRGTLRGSHDGLEIAGDLQVTWKGSNRGPIGTDPPTPGSGAIRLSFVGSAL